ncbi:MAG: cation diffusion facilitator family transporter [Planctomycetaceae bacterium]|nr:cation diffusion facilitator family transporter [Planctomycetaceae bacterium]
MRTKRSQALALALFTVFYNLLEGAVAIFGASTSGSQALLGFGLDSFIESLSGMVIIWRFWKFAPDEETEDFERVEQRAERLVGYTFFILGAYISFDAGAALLWQQAPETSLIGIALAAVSVLVMPVLFLLKFRLGQKIQSRSLIADSKETLACVFLSVALLIGLGAHYLWGLWWLDPVTALIIAVLIVREGFETLGESADD